MARQNRSGLIGAASVGAYHCSNRCLRQAFLCGEDRQSGGNYDHRKSWNQRRLDLLAGIFAGDVLGFSVMTNHFEVRSDKRGSISAELAPREDQVTATKFDEDGWFRWEYDMPRSSRYAPGEMAFHEKRGPPNVWLHENPRLS